LTSIAMTRPLSLTSLFLLPLALLLVQFAVIPAAAQINAPDCLPGVMHDWGWTYNSLNQSPCLVAAFLSAECHNGQFTLDPLPVGGQYDNPSGNDNCRCNTVYYSLISGCAGCQLGLWTTWDPWYEECTKVAHMSTFPEAINNDTKVPAWAFSSITTETWDNLTSCAVGRDPESTGTFRPAFAPSFSTGNSARVGVIVGVVTACTVLFFVLLALGIWYVLRRRRLRREALGTEGKSPSVLYAEQDSSRYPATPWTPDADKRVYDPLDPSTYPPNIGSLPRSAGSPVATTTAQDSSGHPEL